MKRAKDVNMPSGEEGNNDGGNGAPTNVRRETPAGGRRYHHRNGFPKPVIVRQPKFEGKCDGLKGHVYDCSDARQADQYAMTTNEIAEYVGHEF